MDDNRTSEVTVVEMNSDGTNTVSVVPAEEFDGYDEVATSKIGVGTVIAGAAAIVGIAATAKWCWTKGRRVIETYKAGKSILAEQDGAEDSSEEGDEVETVVDDPVTEFVNKRKEEKEGK